ncbi:hypothetical protein KR51_00005270 [Rubidibacter lacunae KORDI 51-2]|uniref:Uncharacterized protein n=1 Tax=Rubidibacter lacunae KORDI 51-2 TaxID=582515 RepID=U5DPB8_9CHRO|nr:hypothetical protein KR51_00005270 [Rubidibacter lacunae KORDI 51-2]
MERVFTAGLTNDRVRAVLSTDRVRCYARQSQSLDGSSKLLALVLCGRHLEDNEQNDISIAIIYASHAS